MAEGYRNMRTEHAGAKNGRGYWGKREEAKRASNTRRRQRQAKLERQYEEDSWRPLDDPRTGEGGADEW